VTRPSPADAHEDNVLMAAIAHVNNQLGRYVLRFLDADAGRADPVSPSAERALADSVAAIAEGLTSRAARRERHGEPPMLACSSSSAVRADDV
jgi:hypothetical protein